jgi:hypothetical protein
MREMERTSIISTKCAIAELKQKLKGKRSDGLGDYTSTIYGIDSEGDRVELMDLKDVNKYNTFCII